MLRLITWNVAGRSRRLPEQAAALAARQPDIIALQEVTRRTEPLWNRAFELMGLPHVHASPLHRSRPGATLVMAGSRTPLDPGPEPLQTPRPESAISLTARTPLGPIELHCVHVPNAANGWVKVRTLEAIRAGLAAPSPIPRILCGDLNTPRRELPDGTTMSFARDSRGRLREDRGAEWDAAELSVVPGLAEVGFRDAFRARHGYAARSPSWTWRTIAGHDGGWRLDHVFVSGQLDLVACDYHHRWRVDGLSDHSALEVDLEPIKQTTPADLGPPSPG